MALVTKSITLKIIIGVVVTIAMRIPNINTFQLISSINMDVVNIAIPIKEIIAALYLLASVSVAKLDTVIPK